MSWTIADVNRFKSGLSARQKRTWVRVANSALSACLARGGTQSSCEASAIQQANAVAGRTAPVAASREHVENGESIPMQFAGFSINSDIAFRYEVLEDRTYLVASVVPIIEGVLNQYYVPREEIAAFVKTWNDVPLMVDHPRDEYGDPVSAKSPEFIEQSIGRFFGAQMSGPRLIGETWVDMAKCEAIGGDALVCLQAIEKNEVLECSTAFFSDPQMVPGIFNNVEYQGTHKHLRPDHLALLPNDVGACSVADG